MGMRAHDGAGEVYGNFLAIHLSKPLDKLKVKDNQ
jgi:hypothetical protein